MNNNLFIAIAIGGIFYIAGQYVASQPQRIEQEVQANREITVQGTGEVTARPDIAHITLGVATGPRASAQDAMNALEQRMNAVIASIKKQDVAEEDIKTTNLSIQPVYDYTEGRQTIRGYEASESVEVKIRDLAKIGTIVSSATGEGVNQAGGISFTIDEPETLQQEAQKKAIENAKENAEQLADALGVGLGNVKTFSASEGSTPPVPYLARDAIEIGGDVETKAIDVPTGTQDITSHVTVTYEIR